MSSESSDTLADFHRSSFAHDGVVKTVYRLGSGPGIVVMTEMPGITPAVADFARRLVASGYSVALPDLFGEAGRRVSHGYLVQSLVKGCVSKEFSAFAAKKTSPVTTWLRALARDLHAICGGPGVGAIGMCFTGGFALAMMVDDTIVAPALCQPALPLAIGAKRKSSIGLSPSDLRLVKERAESGCAVMGMRFSDDSGVPAERFQRLRDELGDSFIGIEIDSSPGNAFGIAKSAHSVLAEHFVDEVGHPTRDALDQLMNFFEERLQPSKDEHL